MSGMRSAVCALNKLKDVDIAFFIISAAIVALIVAVYFLIPVFNKKFYREQRENLQKREASFKSNLQNARAAEAAQEEGEKQEGAEAGDENAEPQSGNGEPEAGAAEETAEAPDGE